MSPDRVVNEKMLDTLLGYVTKNLFVTYSGSEHFIPGVLAQSADQWHHLVVDQLPILHVFVSKPFAFV